MALLQNWSKISTLWTRSFHFSNKLNEVQLLTRLRVVDNSPIGKEAMLEGRPPKIIRVYNKTGVGTIGEMIKN